MKQYLVVVRAFDEPDNNTPSETVWVSVSEFESEQQANQAESKIANDWLTDYKDVEVKTIPLNSITTKWKNISETF